MNLYQIKIGYSEYPSENDYLVVAEDEDRAKSLMETELSDSEVDWYIEEVIHKFHDLSRAHRPIKAI